MQTVQEFLTNPTPTLVPANSLNPIVLPSESTVAGSPYPQPAAVKAAIWNNAPTQSANFISQFFGMSRNRNSV